MSTLGEARAGFKPAPTWDSKIERCKVLAQRYPFAVEILDFYQRILTFQKGLYEELKGRRDRPLGLSNEGRFNPPETESLQLKKGLEVLLPFSSSLLGIAKEGPPLLVTVAKEVSSWGQLGWESLLEEFQRTTYRQQPIFFFPRTLLQPYLQLALESESLQYASDNPEQKETAEIMETHDGSGPATCPFCGHRPQAGLLYPLDNASQRLLICSFCHGEWPYKRLSCPGCTESDKTKLPYFVAEEYPAVRLDVCDTCRQYIKTIDMGKDLDAVPVVDELATVPLDLWARDRGYIKLELNLAGI